jgi:O-antigen/teichoic acid export membrane protein
MTRDSSTRRLSTQLRKQIRRHRRSSVGRHTLVFFVLSVAGAGVTAVVTGLLAAELSTAAFGAFTLSKSLLLFVASIFEFGIFFPGARLTALADSSLERRRWLGALLLAYVPLGVMFSLTMAGVSFSVDSIFNVDAGTALLITAPLSIAYPFGLVALAISQGVGRPYLQPLMMLAAALMTLAGLWVILDLTDHALNLTLVLGVRGLSLVLAAAIIAYLVRPIFSEIRIRWQRMWSETRRWGLQAYLGRLLSVGTYNTDVLILGAFADSRQLAAYGLAVAGASLIRLPAIGLGTALYSRMTRTRALDRRAFAPVVAWGLLATAIGAVAAEPVVNQLNPELSEVASLIVPLGLAATAAGVTSILNAYLNARAAGRALRNTSVILLTANVLLNPTLIIPFGALGAAFASLVATLVNLGGYVYYVRRVTGGPTYETA